MKFRDNVPIYLQIEQYLYRQIALGKLKAGEKIPSVRKLALQLTVNVNTVQRALGQMNERGILYTKRGEGNFVTQDKELLKQTRQTLIDDQLRAFVKNMTRLGVKKEDLGAILGQFLEQGEGKDE